MLWDPSQHHTTHLNISPVTSPHAPIPPIPMRSTKDMPVVLHTHMLGSGCAARNGHRCTVLQRRRVHLPRLPILALGSHVGTMLEQEPCELHMTTSRCPVQR